MPDRRGAWWAAALEPLYALGSGLFHGLHDRGVVSPARLPAPVVSVGNLTVGGTGKTPAVLELCRAARSRGLRPAVLTRGYGGKGRGVLRAGAWPHGRATAEEAGDEALLLSRALPQVPVVVGKRRAEEGRALLESGERVDLFVLDDGFQHRRLHRDRDLILLDLVDPLGNGHLLPAGSLRESPRGLGRADHVLVTGGDPGEPVSPRVRDLLGGLGAEPPCTRAWYRTVGVRPLCAEGPGPESLAGRDVVSVAAIARPERFRAQLAREGAAVRQAVTFRDHHRFTRAEIGDLERRARVDGAALVTTAKDAVRLEGQVDPGAGWLVLDVELEVEGGWARLFSRLTPSLFPGTGGS
jgi:tetraacyldisaccharide 4'-kinase